METTLLTTEQVANRFHELAQQSQWTAIVDELYSEDAASIEPEHSTAWQSVQGRDAIKAKGKAFEEMVEEMHGGYSNAPIVAANFFAVAMGMDCTLKGVGRSQMDEIAVYEVKEGLIVKEQFFY